MNLWLNKTRNERIGILQSINASTNIDELAVEKDWWVTIVLKAIFSTSFSKFLRFKGGTSLSKVWKEINLKRFSEDIDITISRDWFISNEENRQKYPFASCDNNNKIKLLRKASRKIIFNILADELEQQLNRIGVKDFIVERVLSKVTKDGEVPIATDEDPAIINVCYSSILKASNEYIQPKVKIEISCLSMDEPYEYREIKSLINDIYYEEDANPICMCPTILPTRTFLEKAFLLNEEYQKKSPRSERMSRHLYDLEKMMDIYAIDALADKDLYDKIIEHRRKFYHISAVDYNSDKRQHIRICPPEELSDAYRQDYEKMQTTFIYDKECLSYEKLINRLRELENIFHDNK